MDLLKAQTDKQKKCIQILKRTYHSLKSDIEYYSKQKGIIHPPKPQKPVKKQRKVGLNTPSKGGKRTPTKSQNN